MTEAQKAALRSFYSFHGLISFDELAEAETLIRQAKTAYVDIWCPELQQHWVTALKMLGRRRNKAAASESKYGSAAEPKPAPIIDTQSYTVTTSAIPLNVSVSLRVVERRFIGSDHVVIDEAHLILDGIEIVLPKEVYSNQTIAHALKLVSHAPYAKSLESSGKQKVAQMRMRAA